MMAIQSACSSTAHSLGKRLYLPVDHRILDCIPSMSPNNVAYEKVIGIDA